MSFIHTSFHCREVCAALVLFNMLLAPVMPGGQPFEKSDGGAHQSFSNWNRMAKKEWNEELALKSWEGVFLWFTGGSGEESLKP